MRKLSLVLIAILSIVLLTPSAEASAPSNPYGVSTVDPAGPNEIILTVTKGSNVAQFALGRLQKLKNNTFTIYEPFIKKNQSFTAIKMQTLFAFVGIKGSDKVRTTALNDYIFTDSASRFLAANAYLAIAVDGEPIPYDRGGPIRIIFPNNSKWAKNLDAWNWSLASISVK
jgi:hypothetical protein